VSLFRGMVMLRAMVLGRLVGLFTAIQERVLCPSHRPPSVLLFIWERVSRWRARKEPRLLRPGPRYRVEVVLVDFQHEIAVLVVELVVEVVVPEQHVLLVYVHVEAVVFEPLFDAVGPLVEPVLHVRHGGAANMIDVTITATTARTNLVRFITQPPYVIATPGESLQRRHYPAPGHS
jgi:hypothetical protein